MMLLRSVAVTIMQIGLAMYAESVTYGNHLFITIIIIVYHANGGRVIMSLGL